jgi:O-antigen chain-terminating methyltransferase
LSSAIELTKKEIPEFDFNLWKEKYGDDIFYFLFEQKFRGESKIIKEWQKIYLDYVKQAYFKNIDKKWLDIGCGRGEFLELLKENNDPSIGIDVNQVNIDICRTKRLNVEKTDGIEFLKKTEDNSLCGISTLQVIEHLDTEVLKKFIVLCYQKISYNGILILETVNIRNEIASKNFYLDITHKQPIMPEFLKMYLEYVGFNKVYIVYITRENFNMKTTIIDCPDYAIIAEK